MSKVKMKRVFICGLNSEKQKALDLLQRAGVVQITSGDLDEVGLKTFDAGSQRSEAMSKAAHAEQALSVLDEFAPEQLGLLDSMEGVKAIALASYDEWSERIDDYMVKVEELIKLSKQIAEHRAAIPKCQSRLETLSVWQNLDIPLDFAGTEKSKVFIGSVGQEADSAAVYSMIQEQIGSTEPVDLEVTSFSKEKMMSTFMAVCHAEDAEAVESALRRINFVKAPSSKLVPAEETEAVKKEIADHEEAINGLIEEVKAYAPERENIRLAADHYNMEAEKCSIISKLPQSESAFFISGYTPASYADALEKKLAELDAIVEITDPGEDEDVPVALKNGLFGTPVESVVESYSLPNKSEIDPSKIIACFYYILFGLMLSDAGYGLILVIACGYVLLKVKNLKPSMERMMRLMFFCGITTTFWGFMFGSFFGDAVNVVATTFFNRPDIAFRPLWFNSMEHPIKLLSFAFLIGIIHLFTGMFIKLYQLIKAKQYKDALYDVVFWLMFVGGAIIYLLSMQMIVDMLSLSFILSPEVGKIGGYIAIAGCIGVILTGGRDAKNPIIRLLLGLYGAYGITSWLSDVLSYSRLLALGLATGCIAQVFNKLGTMLGNGPVGAVFFIIVFVFGNLLNLAINVLGAYVHTNRLQFVEFFGKFYEGGGSEFEPFTENTKYYSVKEEI